MQCNDPIFVLEDNDLDFETISGALRAEGYVNPLHRSPDGETFLELLQSFAKGTKSADPSIVLLDLNTPGLDGRQVLLEIRSDDKLLCLPVVVLTSSSNPRDVDYCYRHGANAFHQKPLDVVQFRYLVGEIASYWLKYTVLPDRDSAVR